MALQSNTTIRIGSQEITSFKEYFINQKIAEHHYFYVVCPLESLEDINGELTANTQQMLGETIIIETSSDFDSEDYNPLEFKGIITQIENRKDIQGTQSDLIVFSGYSSSIILDDGPHYNSFSEATLSDILGEVFQQYDQSKLETIINPTNTEALHYSVQNAESAFSYTKRLAAQYGEWFFYNGTQLNFGTPENPEAILLKHTINLKKYSLSLDPSPAKYKFFTNNYLTEEVFEKSTSEINTGADGLNAITSSKSDEIYVQETQFYVNTYDDTQVQQRLDNLTELNKKANEINQVKVKGVSDNPAVFIGQIVTIMDGEISQGSFRITKVQHNSNDNGDYNNSFEGVSASIDAYPHTNITAHPKSGTQVAKVLNNVDPDGLSRIQVQFPWQVENNGSTPWIRVLTPHSGLDKGFHFIPEIEEEVLVGFEGGNAERPFVMGALYTGVNKPEEWQTDANNVKAIRTRSGHTIELNDTEGEEKINIYDNEGSIITFDTQAQSLTINATETIDIGAKNINIIAEENINIQAQGNITKAAEGDISIQSQGATNIQATGDASLVSSGAVTVEATSDATLSGVNAVVSGSASAELSGAQAKVAGSAMAEVSGGIVKVN